MLCCGSSHAMKYLISSLTLLLVSISTSAQTLSLAQSGSGNSASITVMSSGQFELVFEAADNWGLSQWYDLVNDPSATTNLLLAYGVNGTSNPCARQNGLVQMVFYGDSDSILGNFEAGC